MKRAVSWLLILCLILSLIPGIPMTASADTSTDPNYNRWVSIRWGENGEYEWNAIYDHEQQQEVTSPMDQLPAGVTYENGSITLENAELYSINMNGWGTLPVHVTVLGENTITAAGENNSALCFLFCHDVTIDGGGSLTLRSEHVTLRSTGTVPGTWSEEGGEETYENSSLVIRNVKIDTENTCPAEGFDPTGGWTWSALDFYCNVVLENVDLDIRGHGGLNVSGDLTVTGCTIDATGFNYSCRDVRDDNSTADGVYPSEGLITDSVVNITDNDLNADWVMHTMVMQPSATLNIGDGAQIDLHHTEQGRYMTALTVNGDWSNSGSGGGLRMEGGSFHIRSVDVEDHAVMIGDGGSWTQTGGEIIIESTGLNMLTVYADRNASWLQTGGSISISNTHPDVGVEDGQQAAALELGAGSRATLTGGTMDVSGDYIQAIRVQGDLILGGTALTLDAYDTGLDLYSKANVVMMGGSLDFTAQNQEMSFGVNSVNGAGFTMTGGTMDLQALWGMPSFGGLYRIYGGEVRMTTASPFWGGREHFTFGEGIRIAYADGTEALWEDDFAVNTDWETVTVKQQNVTAPACSILPYLYHANSVTTGTPASFSLAVMLTKPSETVSVTLPEGAELVADSLYVNGSPAEAALTPEGFALELETGSYVTFQLLHTISGGQTLVARAEGADFPLEYTCAAYDLTLTNAVSTPYVPAAGTAAAGGRLIFYTGDAQIGTAEVNELGTWRTTLELPDAEGEYWIHAIMENADGEYMTAVPAQRVVYQKSATILETLTVGNWLHGPTEESPHEYTELVLDYRTGTASSGYYSYWPNLPEFDFTAAFADSTGTPDRICDVEVVATDEDGNERTVALTYDEQTGLWTGKGEFCSDTSIIPNRFRVRWVDLTTGASGSTGEEEVEDRAPVIEDSTTGAVALVPAAEAGAYRLKLTEDAAVERIFDGSGTDVAWTMDADACVFPVSPGEIYVVRLSSGGFADWPEDRELTVIVESAGPRRVVEYQDSVIPISSEALTDRTDATFTSRTRFHAGDVLLIDGAEAITVTGVSGDTYTYANSGLDEVYAELDITGFTGNETYTLSLGETEEELLERFKASPLYAAYEKALEQTAIELGSDHEFEVNIDKDTKATVTITSGLKDKTVNVGVELKLTTKMTTKLPNQSELETSVEAIFGYEVEEVLNYGLRSMNKDRDVQSFYLITDETVTDSVTIRATIGEEEDEDSDRIALNSYFSDKLADQIAAGVEQNFLEKLKELDEDENTFEILKDVRLDIPVFTGITVYVRPSSEISWGYFGELSFNVKHIESARKGVSIIHLGDSYMSGWEDWSVTKYDDPSMQSSTVTGDLKMHMSAFLYPALRVAVGVSGLKSVNVEAYFKSGFKVAFDGHGTIHFETEKPVDVKAELLVDVTLENEAGIAGFIEIAKKRLGMDKLELELWHKSIPYKQWGIGIMPTRFAVVEEGPVYVSSECDLKRLIDLTMDCQNFKSLGGTAEEAKVLDLDRYTFELVEGAGNVQLDSDGKLRVLNKKNEFEFKVKVTYTGFGTGYRLWKLVDMKYTPGSITITKGTPEGPATCTCMVVDVTKKPYAEQSVVVPGEVTIPAINGHTYVVYEIVPPPKYDGDPSIYTLRIGDPDDPTADPEAGCGFFNRKREPQDPDGPDPIPIDPIGDPSGYVFEGIESNRLSGVTATLYRADDETGTNARLWNAEDYGQSNPLTTDLEGKYMWMVPNGWWQVRYELDGYESAGSEWMVVPPIRTEVNQNLVTDQPASMSLRCSEISETLVLSFSRPVQVSTVTDMTVLVDGEEVGFYPDPVNAQWSVTDDPMDSVVCAVDFRLHVGDDLDLQEKTVTVTLRNAVTYYGTVMEELTAELTVPARERRSVTVIGGSGSGTYEVGTEVTISARPESCAYFDHWECGNTRLYDRWGSETAFRMPDHDVTVTAVYRMEHSYESAVTEPTCTEEGFTTHTCTVCGDSFTDSPTPVTDHSYGDWTLVIAPTVLETGMETRSCTHCGLTENRLVDPLGNPFNDVPEGSFYYDSVLWAVEKGITNGTTPTTFGPGEQCMRAQVVTFLWRAAGSPEPASNVNPFVDVKPGDFYYKAVLWALEEGITSGMDAAHFGPTAYCNRAQVVTFLHRSLGSPAPTATENPFTDVPGGQWYTAPVLWAVEKGVTNGLSADAFGPTAICNRAQIVTFLYRAFAE